MTAKKADFNSVYTRTDPRAYYSTLGDLDYQIPDHGCEVFRYLCGVLGCEGPQPTVLDVCCSYGINAALLNHELTFKEVRDHYTAPGMDQLTRAELLDADRRFFAERRRSDAVKVIGLDASENALRYAMDGGLLDEGIAADLEAEQTVPQFVAGRLAEADLVTVTGGVGYVNERTFETIVSASGDEPPWVAALTLRWIGFGAIADALEEHGLVTEQLDGYVVRQRRFADDAERELVHSSLAEQGKEPTALEEEGWHCAELYLARPEDAVRKEPINELFELMPEM